MARSKNGRDARKNVGGRTPPRRRREYGYIAWKDEGVWTVHSPSVPGVYGLGATRRAAESDFFESMAEMVAAERGTTIDEATFQRAHRAVLRRYGPAFKRLAERDRKG